MSLNRLLFIWIIGISDPGQGDRFDYVLSGMKKGII